MISLAFDQNELLTFEFDRQLDIVSDAFEDNWKRGNSPSVREYAKLVEPRYQKRLLRELILIERECFDFFGDPPLASNSVPDTIKSDVSTITNKNFSIDKENEGRDLPSHFDRFAITKLLGRGSHGVVYEAEDLQIRRRVAIKIAHTAGGDSCGNRAFACEAANASRVNHPSIVRVLDVGEFRGTHFMVSELIEGKNLAEFAKSQKLTDVDCAHIVADIAAGIESAHQFGVIHRDLKPSNIMIEFIGSTQPDEMKAVTPFSPDALHVRILDFGIAKMVDRTTRRTSEGDIVGTPHYMSPEQASGDSARVDSRSDIFSLGVVLFELLSGKVPFDGPELSVITGIRDLKAPSIRNYRDDLSVGLEKIVHKCLERKPSRRYQSAADLEADLRNWIDGKRLSFRRWQLKQWTVSAVLLVFLVPFVAMGLRLPSESMTNLELRGDRAAKLILVSADANRTARIQHLEDWIETGDPSSLLDWTNHFDVDVSTNAAELGKANHIGLTEIQNHRMRIAEICLTQGSNCDSSDAKRFAVELMGPRPEQEKIWLPLLNRMSDQFVRELESMLDHDWDTRKRRVLFGLLKRKWEMSGDTEGLMRLLDASQTEELSLIVPAVLHAAASSDSFFRKSLLTELDNTEPSSEAGLGTDQSSRWRAKLGLVAYGLEEWERVDRLLSRATDPRPRSYFIYWFRQCELSMEPFVRRFKEFKEEWLGTAAIECISSVRNQVVSETMRSKCVELLSDAYQSHPSVGVHNAARKLLIAWGMGSLVQLADCQVEFKQIRRDRNWYLNSSGMQMNIVRGPVEFWYGMPANGQQTGKIHRIGHSFAIADQLVSEKEYAEFDSAKFPHPTDAKVLGTTWVDAVRFCDWMSQKEGLSEAGSLGTVDETFQRYNVSDSGYRLPSTWEWECFFRDGTRTRFRFGESESELFATFQSSIETREHEWTSTTYKLHENEPDHNLLRMHDLVLAKGGRLSIANTFFPLGENLVHCFDRKYPFGFRLSVTLPQTHFN
jgi:serine/threonine protein kinase